MKQKQGSLCVHSRHSGWKLALVIDLSIEAAQQLAVFWMANSGRWTKPTLVDSGELRPLGPGDYKGAHGRALKKAADAAIAAKLVDTIGHDRRGWSE